MGFTVVGNPAATVITSSPGLNWRSPRLGDVRQDKATRLAEDPELTRAADRTPTNFASWRSNSRAKRPDVSQQSRDASTRLCRSSPSRTLPETGTEEAPGENSAGG